ncbi:MAG TPA: phosphatidylglycerophosphatase A [Candidatus Binatia bacterium]|nr:phosphatidylglycerophosphatase A [Candidatus Binatia bacterium]
MRAFEHRLVLVVVTGAGAGYFPRFPGTVGTVAAIPLSLGLNHLASFSSPLALLLLAGFITAAIVLSTKASELLGNKDPGIIVIDEIAGFLVANFLATPKLIPLLLAFVIFRILDVAKVFPASRLEKLPGGGGIVLDDVAAGLYTFAMLHLFAYLDLV